jgi:hypothetical protein
MHFPLPGSGNPILDEIYQHKEQCKHRQRVFNAHFGGEKEFYNTSYESALKRQSNEVTYPHKNKYEANYEMEVNRNNRILHE